MDIATAITYAGGITAISRACANRGVIVSGQAIVMWRKRGRFPRTEWTGETQYARVICELARAFGHEIEPIDLCPGAGQYMPPTPEKDAA